MTFCEYMKRARELASLTQEKAAEKIGVSVTTIQNWEKYQIPSGRENLRLIMETYRVNYDEFWSFYAEAMTPQKNVKKKQKFPYFMFSEEEGRTISSLYLDNREQELLGIEYLYSQPQNITGHIAMVGNINCECSMVSQNSNVLSAIPYEYIKEHGAFSTIELHNKMTKKLGKYKDNITRYLCQHPNDSFDVSTMDSWDIYQCFAPELYAVLHLMEEIGEHSNIEIFALMPKTEIATGIVPTYDTMLIAEREYMLQEVLPEQNTLTDNAKVNFLFEKYMLEGNVIEKINQNTNDINVLYKEIKFCKWFKRYFTLTKSEDSIRIGMSETGRKLYTWYCSLEKGQLKLWPTTKEVLENIK
jgi:transcriptional regulator with XRE-family HTH domain